MKEDILKLYLNGKSYREIEQITGVNRGTISFYCSEKTREKKRINRLNKRNSRKSECIKYKGGECVCCGFNKFESALEFHHLDPKEKEINISEAYARNHSFKKIQKELDKCALVCANCHRGIHSNELVLTDNSRVLVSNS